MGCLCSFPSHPRRDHGHDQSSHERPDIPIGSNKPFRRNLQYRSPEPWTDQQLHHKREVYWDTAPKYDGRMEVWLALKAACEATDDDELAQVILDSAGVTLPTGYLHDGCFDTFGNSYKVPEYCSVRPVNLISSTTTSTTTTATTDPSSTEAAGFRADPGGPVMDIVVRLNTGRDVKLSVPQNGTVDDISRALLSQDEKLRDRKLRFIFMGRPLAGNQLASACSIRQGSIVQVMVASL
eukprot:Partr_v1_DN24326_c0_g1_i1_m31980 putative Ubiquitin domain containing